MGGTGGRWTRDKEGVHVNDSKENCMSKLRQRLQREEGFTLIELLVVIVIIGILLAIAIPSYLGFKDRANQSAASADVRSAIPSAEAFYSDNNTYTGMVLSATATPKGLRSYDSGLKLGGDPVIAANLADNVQRYCLSMNVNGKSSFVVRPAVDPTATDWKSGDVTSGTCPTPGAT